MVNTETLRAIIAYVCLALDMLLTVYAIYRFTKPFIQEVQCAVYAGLAYFFMALFLGLIPPKIGSFTVHCMGVGTVLAVMCAFDQRNYRQKVFLGLLFLSMQQQASALADILHDQIYSMVEHIAFFQKSTNKTLWTGLYVLMCIFYLLVKFSILLIGTWLITKEYAWKNTELAGKELFMLSVFPLVGVVGHFVMRYYRIFYIIKEGTLSVKMDAVSLFFYAVLLAGMVVTIVLYQSIKAEQEDRLQDRLLAGRVEDMKRHIARVEEIYGGIRGLKHDMANHISTLEKLYADKEEKEADAYAARLKTSLADAAGAFRSGNPVTDVILTEQKEEAEKKGISFRCDFHYPVGSRIEAFDMSVILSNALRNAIEYAEPQDGKETYVYLRSYRKANACMIEVRNSFLGSVRIEADTGLIHTSKKEGLHGCGLANIRRTAEKYYGDIDIIQEDGAFCLIIMLMME